MNGRRNSAKRLLAGMLSVTMFLSLVGCAGGGDSTKSSEVPSSSPAAETSSATADSEKIPLSISHHPYMHALPSAYAEQNGLYDTFDYEITYYSGGPTQNEAIASDAWEVGATGIGGAVLGCSGYNMKVIGFAGTDDPTTDIWVRPDSEIAKAGADAKGIYGTAENWKGKKILCASGTNCQMHLIATLKYLGLTTADVEIVDMPVAQCYPAFKAGEADIVCLWAPFGYEAEKDGWVKVSSAPALGLSFPTMIVATEKAVKERPEAIQAWLQKYEEAAEALNKDHQMAATMFYDFEKEQGIKMDEETALKEVTNRPFYTIAENKAWFAKDANGASKAQDAIIQFVDFMIGEGKMKEEDKQKMLDEGFIVSDFIENVK